MGVGTGDLGVRRHPVIGIGQALLGRQQWQHRGQRIDRYALTGRQVQHLAAQFEMIANLRPAVELRTLRCHHFNAQIKQFETVVRSGGHGFDFLMRGLVMNGHE